MVSDTPSAHRLSIVSFARAHRSIHLLHTNTSLWHFVASARPSVPRETKRRVTTNRARRPIARFDVMSAGDDDVDKVFVAVRVRPLNDAERGAGRVVPWVVSENTIAHEVRARWEIPRRRANGDAREGLTLYSCLASRARVDAWDDAEGEDEDVVARGNQSGERLTTERRASRMERR